MGNITLLTYLFQIIYCSVLYTMSTRPGNHVKKKPAQKHQNATAYKFDKYKTDPKAKLLKNLQVINCCPKCTDVIEWKIKYGKYKTLSAPAKCVDCLQKTVKYNYHIRCGPCVEKSGKCAKCGEKTSDFVNIPEPDQSEIDRKEADFKRDLKSLPERHRRTLLRHMEKGDAGLEEDVITPEEKLSIMKEKYGRDGDPFGLDDLDEDLDDLDLDDFSDNES